MMSDLIVTVDLDWACEYAIEETVEFLKNQNISPTIFTTHHSPYIEENLDKMEVGLHPFFNPESSHGSTISETVKYVMDLPHNLPAFRCHRFASCNASKQAMSEAGMLISSNVCTDLEIISPFRDRFGFLEAPIFLEDGGYLWREHPLKIDADLQERILAKGKKVILIHPMHFSINTPHFSYMSTIKKSISRDKWKNMTQSTLSAYRWKGYGIRDFLIELLQLTPKTSTLGSLIAAR